MHLCTLVSCTRPLPPQLWWCNTSRAGEGVVWYTRLLCTHPMHNACVVLFTYSLSQYACMFHYRTASNVTCHVYYHVHVHKGITWQWMTSSAGHALKRRSTVSVVSTGSSWRICMQLDHLCHQKLINVITLLRMITVKFGMQIMIIIITMHYWRPSQPIRPYCNLAGGSVLWNHDSFSYRPTVMPCCTATTWETVQVATGSSKIVYFNNIPHVNFSLS